LRKYLRFTRSLPIAIALSLGIVLSHAYASYAVPYVTLTQAIAKSKDGITLSQIKAGQQILIETNVTNSSIKLDKPLVTVIEVRDLMVLQCKLHGNL
jgi:hypothetical protein